MLLAFALDGLLVLLGRVLTPDESEELMDVVFGLSPS